MDQANLSVPVKSPTRSPNKTSELSLYIRKRGVIKGRLTKLDKYIESVLLQPSSFKKAEFKLRIQGASSLLTDFNEVQSKIEEYSDDIDEQLEHREEFETNYYGVIARADELLSGDKSTEDSHKGSLNLMKLPTLSLPSYDGSFENWLEYRDCYLSLIHNSKEISAIQKFHYLKSSLKGSAELVIDSLEFSAANYSVAWELLVNRYDNNRLLIHNHVKALFSIQPLTKESPELLRKLIDTVLKNIRALKILGEPTEHWDTLIIYIIVSKFDPITEREWEQHKTLLFSINTSDSQCRLKLQNLLDFVGRRADMLETLIVSNKPMHNNIKKQHINQSQKIHCNVSSMSTNKPQQNTITHYKSCPMCHSKHPLYSCQQFLNLSVLDRCKIVTQNKLCENCLRLGHSATDCRFGPCRHCSCKHNTLLHRDDTHLQREVTDGGTQNNALTLFTLDNKSHAQVSTNSEPVLLSTAVLGVRDKSKNYISVRALLDSGSQRSFITQSLCNKINAQLIQSTYNIKGVGSALADAKYFESQSVDILLGADLFWDLLDEGKIRLENGPFIQNTKLGWIISGPIYTHTPKYSQVSCNFTHTLDSQLRKFWELEELPRVTNVLSIEQRACEERFTSTTTRTEEGRFCVRIPFKDSPKLLGESYSQALNRFYALEKRLQRTPDYKQLYISFMREYIELGHMSRIHTYNTPHYIMPHHGVFRAHSTTTKLRVVFDASASTTSGKSLNDLQLVGAPIQGDLTAILLRFRQHRWVACADIEKMYRQVLVHNDHRDLQLILWRENPTDEIGIYQLNTVTYGTASAPFLSVRCLKELASTTTNTNISRIIREDFYVDDLITGNSDSKDNLTHTCNEISRILMTGCFPLRKWIFNYKEDSSSTPSHNSHASKELSLGDNVHQKTLGLGWCNQSDTFNFRTEFKIDYEILTKRVILSKVSKIFDPLGMLSPFIIIAKILLQRLWLLKVGWDEPLPNDVTHQWLRFVDSIPLLTKINIPRHVIGNNSLRIELHIFTDASQVAYGACAYVRSIGNDNKITVRLLCSKGKVAPIKPTSIPRLELCGALLGARLYEKIKQSLRYPHDYYPLSPAHFLVGRPLTAPPCSDVQDFTPSNLTRYQRVEQIRQHFWTRWSKEYISEMQIRNKWKTRQADLKPNTLVLIKDDHLPPLKWRLGRIISTLPGKDGVSRVADIRTETGIVRRAFSKICPLWNEEEELKVEPSKAGGMLKQ
ncbi:uncharacterized protein LOC131854916 [Achroia grisella]|uniref:uncharacterized protein LOC131854916 n=1 Tax=Achroia grisella TaxID=688607 RepID=UPI0027D203FB|nr:uncharacterized protein LOC131854916 [Achroia grisella]